MLMDWKIVSLKCIVIIWFRRFKKIFKVRKDKLTIKNRWNKNNPKQTPKSRDKYQQLLHHKNNKRIETIIKLLNSLLANLTITFFRIQRRVRIF
jgi:hypothetical protein